MSIKVFIDGAAGTTGLRLAERLSGRSEIKLLEIDPAKRKNADARAEMANNADIVFLCLPDDAAKEAVAGITNPKTRVIDASTAHRTLDSWAYGLPELSQAHRDKIINSKCVANPGCYAASFILPVYPLVTGGIIPADYPFTCHGLSGYSGAGRPMIEKYEDSARADYLAWPRQYALGQTHKHLPEMKKIAGLEAEPVFNPIICDIHSGMVVTVPLHLRLLGKKMSAKDIQAFLADYYSGQSAVRVMEFGAEGVHEGSMLDLGAMAGSDCLQIFVGGNDEQAVLISRLDNLGKGASGNAIQCMNIMCGLDEMAGLNVAY